MGNLLVEPIRMKSSEDGVLGMYQYGASAMQGWRISMEDAHIIRSDISPVVRNCSLVAIFDGHGGSEVSKFCASHLAEQLIEFESFKSMNFKRALSEVMHKMDDMLRDRQYESELERYRQEVLEMQMKQVKEKQSSRLDKRFQELVKANEAKKHKVKQLRSPDKVGSEVSTTDALVPSLHLEDDNNLEKEEESIPISPIEFLVTPVDFDDDSDVGSDDGRIDVEQLKDIMFATGAGSTAIVALFHDSHIYLANVGDSRAIICRNGLATPLTEDHKPINPREKARILAAGGFVSIQGRVNDDLNLSRSIGDLRFKIDTDIDRADQIITAEPDVRKYQVRNDDQFIVLACDGVWDVMTNQQVADFVLKSLASGVEEVSQIAENLLDACLSPNLLQTKGMGGDNMTCIIVLLKPLDELRDAKVLSGIAKAVRKLFK